MLDPKSENLPLKEPVKGDPGFSSGFPAPGCTSRGALELDSSSGLYQALCFQSGGKCNYNLTVELDQAIPCTGSFARKPVHSSSSGSGSGRGGGGGGGSSSSSRRRRRRSSGSRPSGATRIALGPDEFHSLSTSPLIPESS